MHRIQDPDEPPLLESEHHSEDQSLSEDKSPTTTDGKPIVERAWAKWLSLIAAAVAISTGSLALLDRCGSGECKHEIIPNCTIRILWPEGQGDIGTASLVLRRGERREVTIDGRSLMVECPRCPVAAEYLEVRTKDGRKYKLEGIVLDRDVQEVVLSKGDIERSIVHEPQASKEEHGELARQREQKPATPFRELKRADAARDSLTEETAVDGVESRSNGEPPTTESEVGAGAGASQIVIGNTSSVTDDQPRLKLAGYYLRSRAELIALLAHPTLTVEDYDVFIDGDSILLEIRYEPSAINGYRYTTRIRYQLDSSGISSSSVDTDDTIFGAFASTELLKSLAAESLSEARDEKSADEDVSAAARELEVALDRNVSGNDIHRLILRLWWAADGVSGRYRDAR